MTAFKNHLIINVYYTPELKKLYVGRLALKDRKIYFEYSAEFLKTGLHLSPLKLPLKPGLVTCDTHIFEGLFGVFNDSLPDGWGRLLLDRKLMKLGINPGQLSPLDRLCYVGNHGLGALTYEPEITDPHHTHHEDLDEIANEVKTFQDTDSELFVDDLFAMNGASAGARPKILAQVEGDKIIAGTNQSNTSNWIIKFRSLTDTRDTGPIEYAYHLMAVSANLDVPEARLFKSNNGPGYFGVKRFDLRNNKRLHMHTISGLLHVDHRVPSLDYETIMRATLLLTHSEQECKKQFRNAVFNVLTHNRDDHAKNFSYLMSKVGTWSVSPAYDLTFSTGPAGEHSTMVKGEGKNPGHTHLLKLADVTGIKKAEAKSIIDEVKQATSSWAKFAKEAGVNKSSINQIQSSLNRILKTS